MLVWDCNAGCFCWFYCCFSFTMQPYRVHLKSKLWTVVRLCLFCQFYKHSTYLTSDAAKDWIVKFVAGWTFSSDSSVWRGRCLGSELCDFGSITAWDMRTSIGRQSGCATTTTTTTTICVLTLSGIFLYQFFLFSRLFLGDKCLALFSFLHHGYCACVSMCLCAGNIQGWILLSS